MDPLSALSIAASIAQFLEFGSRLLSNGFAIYKSPTGSLAEHVGKEEAIVRLADLISKLEDCVTYARRENNLWGTESSAIYALCSKCNLVGEELLNRLKAVRVHGKNRIWKTFRQAFRSVWTEDAINEKAKELASLREELEFHILVDIRNDVDLLSIQQSSRFKELDRATRELTWAVSTNNRRFTEQLSAHTTIMSELHEQTQTVVKSRFEKLGNEIIQELRGSRMKNMLKSGSIGGNPDLSTFSSVEQRKQEKILCEFAALESLRYPSMTTRHEDITGTHENTFRWIFDGFPVEENDDDEPPSSDFVNWLKRGDEIYWVNGKAGSGKSTLMRYLYDHPETKLHLQAWAGRHKLQVGGFFFYNSGTSDQRTQSGLFRGLLHEILSVQPNLIPAVLPKLWIKLSKWAPGALLDSHMFNYIPQAPSYKLSLSELRDGFKALVDRPDGASRSCIFIDGLDEYEGESGHAELVDIMKNLTSSKYVKFCVSSRPWMVFKDAFQGLPGIKLESLTYGDIRQYVADTLGQNPRMLRLCHTEPEAAPKLMDEIVRKAQGVFLWVELVVRSLLSGLANRDRISDLQARLQLLPGELVDLYKVMLLRIDPFYRPQASKIFRLLQDYQKHVNSARHNVSGSRSELSVLKLAFVDSEDVVPLTLESPIVLLTDEEVKSICESTDTRLRSRCAGLLETSETRNITKHWTTAVTYSIDSRVIYLHRTAKDFLESTETQTLLLSWNGNTTINYSIEWLAACVLELKCITLGSYSMWESVANAMAFARDAEKNAIVSQSPLQLLDELDRTATESWNQFRMTGPRRENPMLHWSHYVPINYDGSATPERDTFPLYAAQHGLSHYVDCQKRKNSACLAKSYTNAYRDAKIRARNMTSNEIESNY